MGTPEIYLPPALSAETIGTLISSLSLPPAKSIEPLQVTAAFHSIYLLHFPLSAAEALHPAKAVDDNDGTTITLVLRVSGNHIAHKKTANEVAILTWLREQCPSVPVPAVVRYDTTCENCLGHEFTLLERVPGRSVDKLYSGLSEDGKAKLVRQLSDVVLELNSHRWSHVGGLQFSETGQVVPGPVLEDTFWLIPDVEEMWGPDESVDSLNPTGPYESHVQLVQGYLGVFVHAIQRHSSLEWLRGDLEPRLVALAARVTQLTGFAETRLILAHKDLHFANVMATEHGTLTGILDWEFAGVVPALRWDPVRAFLWNGSSDDSAFAEKEKMRGIFETELERRGVARWWMDDKEDVVNAWEVIKYVRAIVEVCPRGQQADKVQSWRDAAMAALQKLGV